MIPSEYETIISMLLNEVIRLRRENTHFGLKPLTWIPETPRSAVKDKENKVPFLHRAAANQHGHMVAGKWIPNNRIKVPKRGKGGLFTK